MNFIGFIKNHRSSKKKLMIAGISLVLVAAITVSLIVFLPGKGNTNMLNGSDSGGVYQALLNTADSASSSIENNPVVSVGDCKIVSTQGSNAGLFWQYDENTYGQIDKGSIKNVTDINMGIAYLKEGAVCYASSDDYKGKVMLEGSYTQLMRVLNDIYFIDTAGKKAERIDLYDFIDGKKPSELCKLPDEIKKETNLSMFAGMFYCIAEGKLIRFAPSGKVEILAEKSELFWIAGKRVISFADNKFTAAYIVDPASGKINTIKDMEMKTLENKNDVLTGISKVFSPDSEGVFFTVENSSDVYILTTSIKEIDAEKAYDAAAGSPLGGEIIDVFPVDGMLYMKIKSEDGRCYIRGTDDTAANFNLAQGEKLELDRTEIIQQAGTPVKIKITSDLYEGETVKWSQSTSSVNNDKTEVEFDDQLQNTHLSVIKATTSYGRTAVCHVLLVNLQNPDDFIRQYAQSKNIIPVSLQNNQPKTMQLSYMGSAAPKAQPMAYTETDLEDFSLQEMVGMVQITLKQTQVTVNKNDYQSIEYTANPWYMQDMVVWENDDPNIAYCSNGRIRGVRIGFTTVHAKLLSKASASCSVTVKALHGQKITLPGQMAMACGKTLSIMPVVEPVGFTDQIRYTTSNPAVVSISSHGREATLSAGMEGEAVITATLENGTKAQSTVFVRKKSDGGRLATSNVFLADGDGYLMVKQEGNNIPYIKADINLTFKNNFSSSIHTFKFNFSYGGLVIGVELKEIRELYDNHFYTPKKKDDGTNISSFAPGCTAEIQLTTFGKFAQFDGYIQRIGMLNKPLNRYGFIKIYDETGILIEVGTVYWNPLTEQKAKKDEAGSIDDETNYYPPFEPFAYFKLQDESEITDGDINQAILNSSSWMFEYEFNEAKLFWHEYGLVQNEYEREKKENK